MKKYQSPLMELSLIFTRDDILEGSINEPNPLSDPFKDDLDSWSINKQN